MDKEKKSDIKKTFLGLFLITFMLAQGIAMYGGISYARNADKYVTYEEMNRRLMMQQQMIIMPKPIELQIDTITQEEFELFQKVNGLSNDVINPEQILRKQLERSIKEAILEE
jgi:hypothetical protein